jgi:hypothetical protein
MNEKIPSRLPTQVPTTAKQRLAASRQALVSASQQTVLGTLSKWASLQILELLQKKGSGASSESLDKR